MNAFFAKHWTTLIAALVSGLLAYGAVKADVRELQAKYDSIHEDVRDIKSDVRDLRTLFLGEKK